MLYYEASNVCGEIYIYIYIYAYILQVSYFQQKYYNNTIMKNRTLKFLMLVTIRFFFFQYDAEY